MKNLTFTFDEEIAIATMTVNGVEAATMGFDNPDKTCAKIGMAEIKKEFIGKGLYRFFLQGILLMGFDSLFSNNRNEFSNPCWESWTGEELDFNQGCSVCLNNDNSLYFCAEEEED